MSSRADCVRTQSLPRVASVFTATGRWCNTAEHLRARADGGIDDETNLLAACLTCNQWQQSHFGGIPHTDYAAIVPLEVQAGLLADFGRSDQSLTEKFDWLSTSLNRSSENLDETGTGMSTLRSRFPWRPYSSITGVVRSMNSPMSPLLLILLSWYRRTALNGAGVSVAIDRDWPDIGELFLQALVNLGSESKWVHRLLLAHDRRHAAFNRLQHSRMREDVKLLLSDRLESQASHVQ